MTGLKRSVALLGVVWLTLAGADHPADRELVENRLVAMQALLANVRAMPGHEGAVGRAEQLLKEVERLRTDAQWNRARHVLEDLQALLVAELPPQPAVVRDVPAGGDGRLDPLTERQQVQNKLFAVRALLAVVRGQPGHESAVVDAARLIEQADQAAQATRWQEARRALERAQTVLVREVPRPAVTGDAGVARDDEHERRLYADRLLSVQALYSAWQRIAAEEGRATEAAPMFDQLLRDKIAIAESLAAQGHPDDGKRLLDQGYLLLKLNIESLRRGQTLVHEKRFASAADEFAYELDRNDSYVLLVRMMSGWDGVSTPPVHAERIGASARLRGEGKRLAGEGRHDAAIRLLEQSTAELIRVLRTLGLPIPG